MWWLLSHAGIVYYSPNSTRCPCTSKGQFHVFPETTWNVFGNPESDGCISRREAVYSRHLYDMPLTAVVISVDDGSETTCLVDLPNSPKRLAGG